MYTGIPILPVMLTAIDAIFRAIVHLSAVDRKPFVSSRGGSHLIVMPAFLVADAVC